MGQGDQLKTIPIDEYVLGMKIVKCDKSWLDTKLYISNIEPDEMISILKSYGVKEVVVEIDRIVNDHIKDDKIVGEEEKLKEDVAKTLNSLVLSDLNFATNVYPKLLSQVKEFFEEVFNNKLNIDVLKRVTESVCENTLKNPIFVINLSKYTTSNEYLYNHSLNLAFLANTIGRRLGYNEEKITELTMAAFLHDIGKVFIDQDILNKKGKLTDKEFVEIKKHPILGYKYLMSVGGFSESILLCVLEHHEKANGEGYPRGLKSDQISYFAKIIGIIDAYDAITNDTCYRNAIAQDRAIELIKSYAGVHYSKRLIDFIVKVIVSHSIGTVVRLDTGEIGIIVRQSFERNEPVVLIVKDVDKRINPPRLFDLNSYDIKTGQPYKKIVETVSKAEIDFNPAEILYNFLKING